jgi:hypothetical protein
LVDGVVEGADELLEGSGLGRQALGGISSLGHGACVGFDGDGENLHLLEDFCHVGLVILVGAAHVGDSAADAVHRCNHAVEAGVCVLGEG